MTEKDVDTHSGDSPGLGFVDIHCHILPGVDDGARDRAEAIEMLRIADAQHTRAIVTTPHYHPRTLETPLEDSRRRVDQLTRAAAENGVTITLLTGQEVRITNSLLSQLETGNSLTINTTRYVLTEPPFNSFPDYLEEQIEEIMALGYRPVLAHPERNTIIQQDPDVVRHFIALGALTQINTGSLLGHYGPGSREAGEYLLTYTMAHVLATDAHSATGNRVPNMRAGYEAAARLVGERQASMMTRENPLAIIEGRDVPYQPSAKRSSAPLGEGQRIVCAVCGLNTLQIDRPRVLGRTMPGDRALPWHCLVCRNGSVIPGRWRYCNRCGGRTAQSELSEKSGLCSWCYSVDAIPWEEPVV